MPSTPAQTVPVPAPILPCIEYIDTLKVALTVLVIAHHAGQAYGPTGGSWPVLDPQQWRLLGPFFGVNAAFFMGLFFFLSGLFIAPVLARKGPGQFFRDRLVRFGVPIVLVLIGFSIAAGRPVLEFAHLWYLEHLLVYSGLAALWWAWWRPAPVAARSFPGGWAVAAFWVVLTAATFVVRLWWPVDRWTLALGFFRTEVAHLPQYVLMFVLGVVAGRRRWLESLSDRLVLAWAVPALLLSVFCVLHCTTVFAHVPGLFATKGGSWAAVRGAAGEALLCVGLSLGLLGLARRLGPGAGWLRRELAASAYAAYVLHVFMLVALQRALLPCDWPGVAKFGVVVVAGTVWTFGNAALLRRVPGLRSVF